MEAPFPETDFDFEKYGRRTRFLDKLKGTSPRINIILFLLTIATTWLVQGFWYSLSIITILLTHEMGHYLMCRRHGIGATLPYFIPLPFPPFGTMGAVIKMESRIPDRRVLFDVGVAGPLAGLALTIPAIIVGLKLSHIIPLTSVPPASYRLGESFLFSLISKLVIGEIPEGYDVILHPLAFAGWAGLFVTALNLLPIGQLDGGHITYALLGRRSVIVFRLTLFMFIAICLFLFMGWFLLILLLMWFGFKHPPPLNDLIPLDRKRKLIGAFMLVIFAISFTPIPFLDVKGIIWYIFHH